MSRSPSTRNYCLNALIFFSISFVISCGSPEEKSSSLFANCGTLAGIEVNCDPAGKFDFLFNEKKYTGDFPNGITSELSSFDSFPRIGTLSSETNFKSVNPPVWVGSGRTTGTFVNGPNWQSELKGSLTSTFAVSAVLYKHDYTSLVRVISGPSPTGQMHPGPNFSQPTTSPLPDLKLYSSTLPDSSDQLSRPVMTIAPETEMFTIEVTTSGGVNVIATKTFTWSNFNCSTDVPFNNTRKVGTPGGYDGAIRDYGPIIIYEAKRTACSLNVGQPVAWVGLDNLAPMKKFDLLSNFSAGVRGLEFRVVIKYPFYDFYVLFGEVLASGYRG